MGTLGRAVLVLVDLGWSGHGPTGIRGLDSMATTSQRYEAALCTKLPGLGPLAWVAYRRHQESAAPAPVS